MTLSSISQHCRGTSCQRHHLIGREGVRDDIVIDFTTLSLSCMALFQTARAPGARLVKLKSAPGARLSNNNVMVD